MTPERTITAGELAATLDGTIEGDPQTVIRRIAVLEEADAQCVSWAGTADVMPRLETSSAGVVLIPADCTQPPGRTVIRVADPDLAMCTVLELLAPPAVTVPAGVHTGATVADDARVDGAAIAANVYVGHRAAVGAGTQLHPGVYVGDDTQIGRDCILWPNVVVRERVVIGDRVVIHPNTTVGADGFGYLLRDGRHRRIPQIGSVVIEDDVEIGANTSIDRARSGVTRIGTGCKIDNNVQVGHNVQMGAHCIVVAGCDIGGSTVFGDYVVLGGNVGVTDHVRIGHRVQVAAASVVMSNVSDNERLRGIPAIEFHRYQRLTASLRKVPRLLEDIRELKKRLNGPR